MNTNNLTDVEVENVHGWDYPDFADAYVASAVWKDTGEQLTESELDKLNDEYSDFVHEKAHEQY
jgi:hypothetical protein